MPIRPENRGRYPADWAAISYSIRFVRAEGQCECVGECGRGTHEGRCPNRHREPAYGSGSTVVLTTAHLDHQPENCDPANLRAMCQGCHLFYDRDHHAETRAATRAAALASWMDPLPLDLERNPAAGLSSVSIAGLRIPLGRASNPDRPPISPRESQMSQMSQLSENPTITAALLEFLRQNDNDQNDNDQNDNDQNDNDQNDNDLLQEEAEPALWVNIAATPGAGLDVSIENAERQIVACYQVSLTAIAPTTGPVGGQVSTDA